MWTVAALSAPLSAARVAAPRNLRGPASNSSGVRGIRRAAARAAHRTAVVEAAHGSNMRMEGAKSVAVTFTLSRKVLFGQQLLVVGSDAQLGCWDLAGAATMTWSPGDVWQATVELPAGATIEYKFVLGIPHHAPIWETCENRALSVDSSVGVINCAWDMPDATECIPAEMGGGGYGSVGEAREDGLAPAYRPAQEMSSNGSVAHRGDAYRGRSPEAAGQNGSGRGSSPLKVQPVNAAAAAAQYTAEQLEFLKRKLETIHDMPHNHSQQASKSASPRPAASPRPGSVRPASVRPAAQGRPSPGAPTHYTPEQIEFMRRKSSSPPPPAVKPTAGGRPGSVRPAAGRPAAAASPPQGGAAQFTPEQQEFLRRKSSSPQASSARPAAARPAARSAGVRPAAAAKPVSEAASARGAAAAGAAQYSPEQLEFLRRKGVSPQAAAAAPAASSGAGGVQYTPEQLEFMRRKGTSPQAPASPARPSSRTPSGARPAASRPAAGRPGAAAPSGAGVAQYTPEQLEFMRRKGTSPQAGSAAAKPSSRSRSGGSAAPSPQSQQYTPEQLEFMRRSGKL